MAGTPTPIKTDLFRFVTLRTPQLISSHKKKYVFISHPEPSKSFFIGQINTNDINEARKAVREQVKSFLYVSNMQELKTEFPELDKFSSWLTLNKRTLTAENIKDPMSKVSSLSQEQLVKIWDNLFYLTIVRKNPTLRQQCIDLIIANNFIVSLQDPGIRETAEELIQTPKNPLPPSAEKKYELFIRRIAKAKIVIPKAFSLQRKVQTKKEDTTPGTLSGGTIELGKQHLLLKTGHRVESYNQIKKELRIAMDLQKIGSKDLDSIDTGSTDVSKILSEPTKNFLKNNPTKGVVLRMAENSIREKISNESRKTSRILNKAPFIDNKKNKKISAYSIAVTIEKIEGRFEVLLTINAGYPDAYLLSSAYDITFGNNASVSSVKAQENSTHGNLLMLQLFPGQTINESDDKLFRLKGIFTFGNGITVNFDLSGSIASAITYGTAAPPSTSAESDEATESSSPPPSGILYGVNRLGIGVYRKVEQEVCCYVPGEVSRIENILAREYKERQTRTLLSSETTSEDTTSVEVENQNDTVSTSRNEMQTEIANTLEKNNTIGVGASLGVEGKFPGGSITADGNFDFSSSTSSSASDSRAQTYAKEITESALEKIVQKTSQKRTSRILQEYEENNRHGFDNRAGDKHVTGVYRWVDIIYKNRLVNYGKRLMVEFLIPEPARFYKLALEKKNEIETDEAASADSPEAPMHPSSLGINSAEDINENYSELARTYGVTVDKPITPDYMTITKSFGPGDDQTGDKTPNAKQCSYKFNLDFMSLGIENINKYSAYEVTAKFNFDYHLRTGFMQTEYGTYFILKIYNETFRYDRNNLPDSKGATSSSSKNKSDSKTIDLPDTKNALSLSVDIVNVYNFVVNLEIKLKLDEQEKINWQNSVYDMIMKGYDAQVAAYESLLAQTEEAVETADEESSTGNTTAFNRTVEQREIERIAIEMLTQPFAIPMGGDFYSINTCNVPAVEQTEEWETYSSHVKFFEQAFDWKVMAYIFYPYYWADKCSWASLMQTKDADDPIFEAFLQSGMARVVVPVREGFEEAVDYYMETGDIWNGGGLVLDTDDDLYVSIDEELEETEGVVDLEWETRVPTSLTIVQGNSVYLEDEGLPCCDDISEDGTDTLLRSSTAILGEQVTNTAP